MSRLHLVRVGTMGVVGRFDAAEAGRYARHTRVVVRTARGMEIGEVLSPPDELGSTHDHEGTILRAMTIEDRLLESRLAKNSHAAFAACQQRLNERGLSACLMDVEHLFDGRTLVFYFLGDVPAEVEHVTGELAEVYEAKAQFRNFADTLTNGCGPDCGTESAAGHGCTSCATGCAVASACSTRRN
ncbi:MAG TPA: PSP1 C-terminal domain-containing protein [Pirellulales bacterium]|nr:PSP1 C-terminal domain-containing protein [Pirellulales bacterium]